MKKFLEMYNDIIQNFTSCPEYIGRNIFNIMNEWVESPDLVQFPKELQIELCKNLRKHFDNLYIISYKKIIEILEKYDYDYFDDVLAGMKKYDIVIVGAGPAGLFCAYELVENNRKFKEKIKK